MSKSLLFGLITRRQRWGLSLYGFGCLLLLIVVFGYFFQQNIHSYLAINKPIASANLLVVDGPIPEYAVKYAIEEFQKNSNYRLMVTTGGPISRGYMVSDLKSYSELTAAAIIHQGFDSNKLVAISREPVVSDRTYANALSFREWCESLNDPVESVNVFCIGTHARRTQQLYQMAFGKTISVGILANPSLDYDAEAWWKSSFGFRTVIGEIIAYFYARFIFSATDHY